MTRRRIFFCMGLCVLLASGVLCRDGQARETYRVRPGDTLSSISATLGVTPDTLKAVNRIKNNNLKANQILTVPASKVSSAKSPSSRSQKATSYRVRKGDTLAQISKKTGVSVADLRAFNELKGNALKIGQIIELTGNRPDAAAPEPHELAKYKVKPASDLEEEEEDGGLTSERAWAEIEKHEKQSALLFGHWDTPEEQQLLVKVARGFLGAPYRLGGSSVTGIDCSGFVKKIYQFFNIDLPRTAFEQSLCGLRVSRNELVEGDLLFFNTRRTLGHVGIYIGNNEFVHASSRKRGVRIDNLNMPYFDKRFVRAVRLKGSDEGL
jgi:peptidoglycan DL-endopeptidase LytE